MRRLIPVILTCAILSLPAAARADDAPHPVFFQNLADVPVMPGLTEAPDAGVVFDKPEGRIVEAAASSASLSPAAISRFYDTALPQLGWRRSGPGVYAREGETLAVKIEDRGGFRLVRLTITPAR